MKGKVVLIYTNNSSELMSSTEMGEPFCIGVNYTLLVVQIDRLLLHLSTAKVIQTCVIRHLNICLDIFVPVVCSIL